MVVVDVVANERPGRKPRDRATCAAAWALQHRWHMRGLAVVLVVVLAPALAAADVQHEVDVMTTAGFTPAGEAGFGYGLLTVTGGFHAGGPVWFRVGGGVGIYASTDINVLAQLLGGVAVRACATPRQTCIEAGVDVGVISTHVTDLVASGPAPELAPRIAGRFGGKHASFVIEIAAATFYDSSTRSFYPGIEAGLGFGYAW